VQQNGLDYLWIGKFLYKLKGEQESEVTETEQGSIKWDRTNSRWKHITVCMHMNFNEVKTWKKDGN